MSKIIKQIPNLISLLNLFFGCLSVVALWEKNYNMVFIFISAALICDLLDGAMARLLDAQSSIGKELDSLADMISFGFFPGLVIFVLLQEVSISVFLPYLGFFISIFSAIRLAKFNIDDKQAHSFLGLPTPANTIWILGLLWFVEYEKNGLGEFFGKPGILLIIIGLSCFLLIVNLPMFSFKMKRLGWKGNEIKLIFILVSLVLFAIFKAGSIFWIMCFYILLSVLNYFLKLFDT